MDLGNIPVVIAAFESNDNVVFKTYGSEENMVIEEDKFHCETKDTMDNQ